MARRTTEFIIVHCADTYVKMAEEVTAAVIDRWHRTRGFLKIGYQYVIRRNGMIEDGRDLYANGAHAKGYNHKSVGICMVGGRGVDDRPENNFTPEQFQSLEDLLKELKVEFPIAKVIGHNEISSKACPSFDVQEWLIERGLTTQVGDEPLICPTCGRPCN